jgi:glycosyltransferase involved in cell wall biosynthesis
VGRTLLELLPRLATRTPLVALVDARRPAPDLGVPTEGIGAPRGVPRLGWLELGVAPWLARRQGTLLHGAAYALPLRWKGPAVVTLHDVAWETHPRDFGPLKRRLWRISARRSAAAAGAVLTVSEFSKRAIVDAYGLDPSTVLVAANAPAAIFSPSGDRAPESGLPPRYVVAVGGAPRRNLPLAIEAWRRARASAPVDLVVIGAERPADEPGLMWLGSVDSATWAGVLAGAEALVYPTSYEGFGLPAAEACASGVPVVCARVASLPEVLGEAAAWAPRLDADAFAATLAALLTDSARRQQLSEAGLSRARQAPTWDQAADTTVEAYQLAWSRWSDRNRHGAGR